MKITLTSEEIQNALANAVLQKTGVVCIPENIVFEITDADTGGIVNYDYVEAVLEAE